MAGIGSCETLGASHHSFRNEKESFQKRQKVSSAMKDWAGIVSRHLTTVLVVVALMWTIAKPHAEDFIRTTVDDRITRIEQKLDSLEDISRNILSRLDKIENRITKR